MQNSLVKRFLCFAMAVILLGGMLPAGVQAAGETTVYLDATNGADTNTGLTQAQAVQSLAAAYEKLIAVNPESGKIVIVGTLVMDTTAAQTLPAHSFPVTLTGKTGTDGIKAQCSFEFQGPTTIENITFTLNRASNSVYLTGGGHPFVIGENVTSKPTGSSYYCLVGGSLTNTVASVDMTVKSGTWRNIFGVSSRNVTGNVTMNILGGKVVAGLVPFFNADVGGNATVNVKNATVAGIYGASSSASTTKTLSGNLTITLGEGTKVTNCYAASHQSKATVNGTITVILDGMTESFNTFAVTGSKFAGSINATRLVLKSGKLSAMPTGFDTVELAPTAGKTLELLPAATVAVSSVTGGGNLCLGSSTGLLVSGNVTGETACTISGTVQEDFAYITAEKAAQNAFVFPESTKVTYQNGVWVNGVVEDAPDYTVFVNGVSGTDSNPGYTQSKPVATLEKAYTQLEAAMIGAPAGTAGTIVFTGNVTLELSANLVLPSHDYPVILTSLTGAEGLLTNNTIDFSGDTTLENITVTLTAATGSSYFLAAGGHKLVIGEKVTSKKTGSYYLSLLGTARLSAASQVNLTVKSGSWRGVYGLFGQKVNGDIHIDIQGGTFDQLYPAYNNDIEGNAYIQVRNATIGTAYLASSNTLASAIGTAKGDITLTLGEGAKITNVYCSPSGNFCVDGTVNVVLDGITQPITILTGAGKSAGSGTIGKSRLVLKSGSLSALPVSFDTVELAPEAGKTLTLAQDGTLTVSTVTGGGNLVFAEDARLHVTGMVSGKTACSVSGTLSSTAVYIEAPTSVADDAFTFPEETWIRAQTAITKQWSAQNVTFTGATITVNTGTTMYDNLAAAVAAYSEGYITLWESMEGTVTVDKEIYLDMNGYDATVSIADGGMVYGADCGSDDYQVEAGQSGVLTVLGGAVAPQSQITRDGVIYRYLAMKEQEGYSFHRFSLETKKGLRPYNDTYGIALYYQPYFQTDAQVAAAINSTGGYGVCTKPDNGGETIHTDILAYGAAFDPAGDNSSLRVVVPELIPSNQELESGSKTLEKHDLSGVSVAGSAYIRIQDQYFYDDTGVCITLKEAVEKADTVYASLNDHQKTSLEKMFAAYSKVIAKWEMPNLKKAVGYEDLEEEAKTFKILAIGNSYSLDALWHLGVVAKSQNFSQNVEIGILYYNGCWLERHVTNLQGDVAAYTYYKWDGSKWTAQKEVTMKQGLTDAYWDVITMQQASVHSGRVETYNSDIQTIINYVDTYKRNDDAQLVWHMTWSYPEDPDLLAKGSDGFRNNFEKYYGSSHVTMYNKIVSAVQEKILTNNAFDLVVPTGTMVMNSRSSYMEEKELFRDNTHLNDYSRCMAAHLMYAMLLAKTDKLTSVNVDKISGSLRYLSADKGTDLVITEDMKALILESVNNALKTPYAQTQSQYTTAP